MDRSPGTPPSNRPSDPNRRSSPRVPVEVEVAFHSESQFYAGLTSNISAGGVFVATYRALPIGCRVELRLALPDGELTVKGQVRWRRDASGDASAGLGIAFEEVTPEEQRRITRFCDFRPPLLHDED